MLRYLPIPTDTYRYLRIPTEASIRPAPPFPVLHLKHSRTRVHASVERTSTLRALGGEVHGALETRPRMHATSSRACGKRALSTGRLRFRKSTGRLVGRMIGKACCGKACFWEACFGASECAPRRTHSSLGDCVLCACSLTGLLCMLDYTTSFRQASTVFGALSPMLSLSVLAPDSGLRSPALKRTREWSESGARVEREWSENGAEQDESTS
mmetsp:Transcript_47786/g.103576  ORF Transcript_47786/g.103576 Transcript_47786/m.103576 type:complete len:212 (-) Transcript_47786:564-1199(-)